MTEMMNVILVGGKFAGLKTQVPKGLKVLNIPNPPGTGDLVEVSSHADVQKHLAKAAAESSAALGGRPQTLEDCDNPYMLWPATVALPTLNDAVSFTIGAPPGTKMSDAFMSMVAAYCMLCRPQDYEDDDTPFDIGPAR